MRMEAKKEPEESEGEGRPCCPFTFMDDGGEWIAGTCLGPDCAWWVRGVDSCAVVGLFVGVMGLSTFIVKQEAEKKKGGLFNEGPSKN